MQEVKADTRGRVTVYHARWADSVLSRHSGPLNEALECWAVQLASVLRQEIFSSEDWELLAVHIGEERPSPRDLEPGAFLGRVLETYLPALGAGLVQHQLKSLARSLRSLSYLQAWAVLTSLDWHRRNPTVGEWWTLAARQ